MESDSTLGSDWHVNSHYLKWSLETYPSGQNFSLLIDSYYSDCLGVWFKNLLQIELIFLLGLFSSQLGRIHLIQC